MRRRLVGIAVVVALVPLAVVAEAPVSREIAAAVADTSRPATDTRTDADRKPAATLAFAGVRPGMVVGEFFPGGGYFTRMLGDVVGPQGHVYGIENDGWKSAFKADQALLAEGRLTNVSVEALPFGTVSFPRPLDLVWITQNYHDLKIAKYGEVDTVAFDRAVFAALKPGGIFLVLDHEAPPGTDRDGITKLHRIEKAQVIREVTSAGFRLEAEGTFLRQPGDDHTRPIFDEAIRFHTDQYALKFVKPRG